MAVNPSASGCGAYPRSWAVSSRGERRVVAHHCITGVAFPPSVRLFREVGHSHHPKAARLGNFCEMAAASAGRRAVGGRRRRPPDGRWRW